ncbi:protein Iojap, chloroplastic [Zea mays]|uniref:Protein Iojap, chloroplastic n=2 Tax=Zea mays TaxID=4577 RepID=IOJAP_MAIZE|nr:protein Iojap, chloroplastic [Zea mays]Q41822.1 RecName: Full=Protein Iojap, chloroplastic; Flags: Precursor [Zea mays]AAA11464.1 iojap [Zea mays]ONM55982.1 Protein Iojap, chloroplast [Zea mays]CAA78772.1 putative iojap protein [Zea mays]|eukprot:NP_001105495.1 protein Iojap, chloroplastic [Zea mays]
MGGTSAAVPSHGLACAPPAAVTLNPRARRRRASSGSGGHRSSPQQPLRSDLLPPATVACRARSQSASSSNVNFGRGDDADKLLEDLLKQHGEVVYSSGGPPDPTVEADDDAECLSFAVSLAKAASEIKATDIRVLCVRRLVYWTRFFIILTAFSNAQIDAISSKMRDIGEKQFSKVASGDTKPNSWTLLDFGDVVVHIFLPQQRAFYNLEEFYGNATPIELPFDTQRQ